MSEENMNDPILNAVITGFIGLASGAALAYLGAILKFRKDLEAEYDKDLRRHRIDAYVELWKPLELLARYDRPKPLNRKTLKELSVAMREWYFRVGGLFLSEDARKAYFVSRKRSRISLKAHSRRRMRNWIQR